MTEHLKRLYEKPRNWGEIAKELEAIISPIDEYVLVPIEYNTDTSALPSLGGEDIVRPTSNSRCRAER